jgi:membrane protease YdiL (CAAX protease family)
MASHGKRAQLQERFGCRKTRFGVDMTQAGVFVVLVFAIPWIVGPWLPQQPQTRWEVIASYVPGVWAPTVVAIVMMAWTSGIRGFGRELKSRLRIPSVARHWLLFAIVAPTVVTFIGIWGARLTGDGQAFVPMRSLWSAVVNAMLTGAVGEELGWRGFLLTRLGERLSARNAVLVMSVLWGLWHLPIFLFPDSPYSTWPIVPALATIVAFGTVMGGLFYRTDGSILPTILAHLSLNVALGVGGAQLSSSVLWWTTSVVFAAMAFAVLQGSARQGTNIREVAQQT